MKLSSVDVSRVGYTLLPPASQVVETDLKYFDSNPPFPRFPVFFVEQIERRPFDEVERVVIAVVADGREFVGQLVGDGKTYNFTVHRVKCLGTFNGANERLFVLEMRVSLGQGYQSKEKE